MRRAARLHMHCKALVPGTAGGNTGNMMRLLGGLARGGLLQASWGPGGALRHNKQPRVVGQEGNSGMQSTVEHACWPAWRQLRGMALAARNGPVGIAALPHDLERSDA